MVPGDAEDEQADDDSGNPLRALTAILDHRAAKLATPRPETDRRTNYREAPAPPGVDLTSTAIEDAVRRDPAVIEHVHEVAHATARNHAAQRVSIRIDASTGRDILDYLDSHRATLPAELRARIDTTADRLLRRAYAAATRTRLVCPHCNGMTVVPTPDLASLVCLDQVCAPDRPRPIDPAYAQKPERRITLKDLALLAGEDQGTMRKRLWRAKIQPVHTGPHNRHEYRWADVAHLVRPAPVRSAAHPSAA